MTTLTALPLPAPGQPLTLAAAKQRGLTWRTLNESGRFLKVAWNLYTACPPRPEDQLAARALAAVTSVGGPAAACGLTALALMGVQLPDRLEGGPLEIQIPAAAHRSVAEGLRVRRQGDGDPVWRTWQGVPCAAPWVCWLQAAARVTAGELVLLGDGLLRRRRPVTDLASLQGYVRDSKGSRGLATARAALTLIRPGTDSIQETSSRLLLVRSGLPCPAVNLPVVTRDGKKYLDMAYPEARLALEYDGQHHEGSLAADARRRRALEDLGWRIVTITGHDLRHDPASVVRSVTRALTERAPALILRAA